MDYISTNLWLKSELDLHELCKLIQEQFNLNPFDLDAENLYEWGEAIAQDGSWTINISRKHDFSEPLPNEPYHVLFGGTPPALDNLAQQIATVTRCKVHLGKIKYIGGDDYEYFSTASYR
ncbi:MAG: hypothetical protein AB1631_23105 [Acidobacteriota bacterium]